MLRARVRTRLVQYRSILARVTGSPGSSVTSLKVPQRADDVQQGVSVPGVVALLVVLQGGLHGDGGVLLHGHEVEVVAQLSPVADGFSFVATRSGKVVVVGGALE